jgi:putative radical SAM enzyme (TIGR03279 family)
MLKIKKIITGSPADNGKLQAGDELLSINGYDVADIIDYRFHQADACFELVLKRKGEKFKVKINKDIDCEMGLIFYTDRITRCNNKCIFCFCHNNPKRLRRSLYIKDDDYRLSFLHGNFITLTNLSETDIQRIIDMKLSPLYVSVQATDDDIRRKLFARKNVPPILPVLRQFVDNNIYFHCQVVVVPGYNDKEILYKTAADLAELQPHASSLAIVPVGLTRYSNPGLKPVSIKRSAQLVKDVLYFRKRYGTRGNRFAYAADELFINANLDIPAKSYYDDFPQVENGVGMVRRFIDSIPGRLTEDIKGCWITGRSMLKVWRKLIIKKHNLKLKLVPVTNYLFGPEVTVSGLLAGKDILNALSRMRLKNGLVILPPNCLNDDGLFIDNLTPSDIENRLGVKVIRGTYSFAETFEMLS